jgi:Holliday junction resolvase-like predicted endonuclease
MIKPKPDFERYIHIVLREHGYEVSPAPIIRGACVTHEIDGIAEKEGKLIYLEVKNHSSTHVFTPFEVTLSAKAKLDDIREGFRKGLNKYNFDKVLIVCNTRFTEHAGDYAHCIGIEHLGWDVPKGRGLEWLIEEMKVYPVTMLPDIKEREVMAFSENDTYTLKQMVEDDAKYSVSDSRLRFLREEASSILKR